MPQPLDGKVYGILHRTKDNSLVPPDQFIVFQTQDKALVSTLEFYWNECQKLGCDKIQLDAVRRLTDKVRQWQKDHPERMKVADVEPNELAWGKI